MNKRPGEVFARDPAAMIGKNIWAEFPEGIGQAFYNAYHKAMREQQYIHLEEYYRPINDDLKTIFIPPPKASEFSLET